MVFRNAELFEDSFGYAGGTCRNQYLVIRCKCRPTESAIAQLGRHSIAKLAQYFFSALVQCFVAFDGEYSRSHAAENCSLITAAGTDFKNTLAFLGIDHHGLECYGERLGDRLLHSDWEGFVLVCSLLECRLYETMPRHDTDGFECSIVGYTLSAKFFDQALLEARVLAIFSSQGIRV